MAKRILKILCKTAAWLMLAAGFLLFALHLALQYLLPSEYIKNKITRALEDYTKMSVRLDYIRGGLGGLRLEGLSILPEDGGAPLLSAQSALARVAPLKLLRGEISVSAVIIDGLAVRVERNGDGSFNFDKLIAPPAPKPAPEPSSPPAAPFNLRVAILQARNCAAVYLDRQNNIDIRAENIFIDVRNFSFAETFSASLNANLFATVGGVKYADGAPLGLAVYPELKNLDMRAAGVLIKRAVLRLAQSGFILSGSVENFAAPQINLNLLAQRLDAAAFKPFASAPDFYAPRLDFTADAKLDLAANKITVNRAALDVLSSSVVAGGIADFSFERPYYNFNVKADILLEPLAGAFDMLKPYQISGALTAAADIARSDIKASAELKNAAVFLPQAGKFTEVNFKAEAENIKDIKLPSLTGKLNGHAFSARASYLDRGEAADVNLFLRADKILAKTQQPAAQPPAEPAARQPRQSPQPAEWPLPPLNIKADVAVANFDTRYFSGSDIAFKADVKNIAPDLGKAEGRLWFNADKGQIKDLYRLTNANALTKVLFMSLGVVSTVVNALDVLGVLKSIGAAVAGGGKKTEADDGADNGEKLSGRLDYDIFMTELNFKAGAAELKSLDFASDKFSFVVSGGMDFAGRNVDMTVRAAPGRVSAKGIMPLTLKIGGTIDEPKGSMSMLASTAALVRQSLLNNPAANLIKSGLGGLLGIGGGKAADPAAAGASADNEYIPLPQDVE